MTTLGPLLTSKMIFLALKFWPLLLVPECRKGLQKGAKKETSPCRKFFYQLVSTYTDCALVKRVIEEKLEVSSKESVKKILIFCHLFKKRESMVFCYQNCSDLLWENLQFKFEKKFWDLEKLENVVYCVTCLWMNYKINKIFS